MKTINFSAVEPAVTFDGDKKNNPLRLSEICFAGRSNVGKSSLINSLTNRKNIAKTSNKPGHTKKIFFYKIDQAFIIVDLPGYGYAKLAKKKKAFLSNLLFNYLTKSEVLLKRLAVFPMPANSAFTEPNCAVSDKSPGVAAKIPALNGLPSSSVAAEVAPAIKPLCKAAFIPLEKVPAPTGPKLAAI